MRLFFVVRDEGTSPWVPYALVRWYEPTGAVLPAGVVCLDWASGASEYDIIPTSAIRRPVTLQNYYTDPLPDSAMDDDADVEELPGQGQFVLNHFL